MSDSVKLTLYRASEKDSLQLPDKQTYGDQYGLYEKADRLKPKNSIGRLGSIFAGVFLKEAKQWGDKIWEIEAEVPYKNANAYDITKWTELVEFYLTHAHKNDAETNTKIEDLIKEYWTSEKPIKEIKEGVEKDSTERGRWEVLLSPEWVTEVREHLNEVKGEFKLGLK